MPLVLILCIPLNDSSIIYIYIYIYDMKRKAPLSTSGVYTNSQQKKKPQEDQARNPPKTLKPKKKPTKET